jgi:hypothetical protein
VQTIPPTDGWKDEQLEYQKYNQSSTRDGNSEFFTPLKIDIQWQLKGFKLIKGYVW